MENIGKLLKEKRLELGLTIEEISEKTRLTTKHIKALEEGDISFFKNDLSYLRFFVKSYCEAVGIDFEDVKDDLRECVDDYTMAFTNTMTMEHEEMEKRISKTELSKVSKTEEDGKKVLHHAHTVRKTNTKKMKKPDFSLVSLIAVAAVVAIILMAAFVIYLNSSKKDDSPDVKPPVADVPSEGATNTYPKEDEKPKEEEEKKELTITKNDATHYTVTDYKEGDEITIGTLFIGCDTAYSVTVVEDGKSNVLSDPAGIIYYSKDHAEKPVDAKVTAKKGTKVQLYFGHIYNIGVKVNDKSLKIDESVMYSGGSYTLEITFG